MKPYDQPRLSRRSPRVRTAIAKTIRTLEDQSWQLQQERTAERKKTAVVQRALQAPFEKIIAESPTATRALEQLRQHPLASLAKPVRPFPVRDHAGGPMLSLHLQEHISVVIPPYDFDWQRGNPYSAFHDRLNGEIGCTGRSGSVAGGVDGKVDAAAGIGLALTTDRPATVSVRPYIEHSWAYGLASAGLFSTAETSGGIDAAVFLNGALILPVQRSVLFSASCGGFSPADKQDGGGIAWVPDLTLGFDMDPGQVVVVNFGGWLECDHDHGIGAAASEGLVHGYVKWIIVERFVGP